MTDFEMVTAVLGIIYKTRERRSSLPVLLFQERASVPREPQNAFPYLIGQKWAHTVLVQ
jgi:hypothetical protein